MRLRKIVRWLWPLVAAAGTVFAVWLVFQSHDYGRSGDAWLLAFVGTAYLIAVAFVLIFTRRWDLRALGQVVTYFADAGLYIGAGGSALGWRRPLTPEEVNLIRSGFVVGGACLVIGLVTWTVRTRGGRRNGQTPTNGMGRH